MKVKGRKTYVVGIVGILTAAGGYWSGMVPQDSAVIILLGSLSAMGLRHGMANGK
jgi:hypothetical protein